MNLGSLKASEWRGFSHLTSGGEAENTEKQQKEKGKLRETKRRGQRRRPRPPLLQNSARTSPRERAPACTLFFPTITESFTSEPETQGGLRRHDCSCCQRHTEMVEAGVGKCDFFWSPEGLQVRRQAPPKLSSSETRGIKWVSIIRQTFHGPPLKSAHLS